MNVISDANVPIKTATDAGSIQLSFCRAITNTFSAEVRAESDKYQPKYGNARLRISTMGNM